MTWQQVLWLVGAIICAVLAIGMLRNSDVIRKKYPWVGWAIYLILIVLGFGCYARTGLPL